MKKAQPQIAVIMGSDSDLPIMKEAAQVLEEFGVPYHLTIVSAHRSPEMLFEFGRSAAQQGFKIVIAGAGGSAHLPGMVAALTTLPVIGVPIKTSTLSGVDSLYSIVQMPPGVPVATMAINGAKNAGLMAIKILAISDEKLAQEVRVFMKTQVESVKAKAQKLEKNGYTNYK